MSKHTYPLQLHATTHTHTQRDMPKHSYTLLFLHIHTCTLTLSLSHTHTQERERPSSSKSSIKLSSCLNTQKPICLLSSMRVFRQKRPSSSPAKSSANPIILFTNIFVYRSYLIFDYSSNNVEWVSKIVMMWTHNKKNISKSGIYVINLFFRHKWNIKTNRFIDSKDIKKYSKSFEHLA